MKLEDKLIHFKNKGWKYDHLSGEIWSHKNKLIKNKHQNGYIQCSLRVENKVINILAHHLVWYLYYGEVVKLPLEIDHIDRDPSNNKIENLRKTTKAQNRWNKNIKGYGWHKRVGKWVVNISANNKKMYSKYHDTEEEAKIDYLRIKEIYHNYS